MLQTTGPLPGREARFPVLAGKSIGVAIERGDDSAPQKIDGELIDISWGGLKLTVPSSPAMHEAVVVRLSVPEIDLDFSIDAKVCWSQPAPKDLWYLGCALDPRLPDHVLTKLATAGYLQRRQDERHLVDLPVTIRCEGAQETAPAQLLDYSVGGLRLSSPQSAEMGQRLLLQLDQGPDGGSQVVTKAVWQVSTADGYEIGCTFINKDGHRAFQEFFRTDEKAPTIWSEAVSKKSPRRLLVLAALLAVATLTYFFLL